MRTNRLRELFELKQPAIMTWVSIPSSFAAELISHTGCDATCIDMQHSGIFVEQALPMLQAISATPSMPVARISQNNFFEINKVLDSGAYGVICPLINTAADAKQFVNASMYPPLGGRSFGPARGLLYGGADYFQHANQTILRLAMIETAQGLDNLEEILAVPGLDGVFIGPSDLSLTLTQKSPVIDLTQGPLMPALKRIREITQARNAYAGVWCNTLDMAQAMIKMGFDMVVPGQDAALLRQGMTDRVTALRTLK
jgi:4-hydroxy-2-oxoheptanedioate aldolase